MVECKRCSLHCMSPQLAHRVDSLRCDDSDAIGAKPDMPRASGAGRSDENVATGSAVTGPLVQATHSVPIVFVLVPDPVGAGFVDSLARPGGNATGFLSFEYGLSGKWLTILKEIAPTVTRAGVIRDPAITAGIGQFAAIQSVAPLVGTEVNAINVRDASEIERAVAAFAGSSNGGLIVTGSGLAFVHRNLLVTLAAQHKLPAVYWDRTPVIGGGLISNRYDHLCEAGPSMKRREFLRILGWGSRRIT